jgi:uncharacterized membrane protein YwaF
MEQQPLFGVFHLVYLVVGFIVVIIAAFLLRKTTERQNRVLLLSIGLFLLVSEAYKQLFWFYAIGYADYPFIILPFHLCSIPLYLCIVLALVPEGRFRQAGYAFLASFCFVGGLISVTVDGGLLRDYWMMTFHSMNWHFILIFLGLYLGLSGRLGRSQWQFIGAVVMYLALALVAFLLNIALWDISKGTCDMFFVGPAPMNVVVFRDIGAVVGRPLVTALYVAVLTLASWASWLLLRRLGARSGDKRQGAQ